MKIALVYRSLHLAGSLPRFHAELARHLSGRGHDVHVYSIGSRTDTSAAPGCTFHDVPVWALGEGVSADWRELLSFSRNVRRLLARADHDVVHVRLPSTWDGDLVHVPGVVRGEAEAAGVSPARTALSSVRHPGGAARLLLERRAVRNPRVAGFHVDAPLVRDHLVRFYGVDPGRITVARPGVDLAVFTPPPDRIAARAEVGLPTDDRFLVLFSGHDFERKGLDRAIEALAAMREPGELVVLGRSSAEAAHRRLAGERGVADRVRFVGDHGASERFYRAADAFLLPTRSDIWGVTVVEAMATGLPCVVSSGAGSSAVVDDGRSGFVVPEPTPVDALAAALDRLAASSELRRAMGAAGQEIARDHSWQAHGALVERDLAEIVERRRSSR